jgi:hypothetical protein
MITAAQCTDIARQCKTLASAANRSEDQAFLLRNIAKSFAGAAGQLDRLDSLVRDEKPLSSPGSRSYFRSVGCKLVGAVKGTKTGGVRA